MQVIMGWTGIKTDQSFKQVFESEFSDLNVLKYYFHTEYPDTDCQEQSTLYAAVKSSNNAIVFALVVLFKRYDNEVLFKVMDETVGPYYYDCPKDIIDMLTPTEDFDSGYAKEWRIKCKQNRNYGN